NIEFNMTDEELITLKQKEKESVQNIRYLTGNQINPSIETLPVPENREISIEEVLSTVSSSNPELKIQKIITGISRDQITQKKNEYIPDTEFGVSYMQRQNGNGVKRDDMITGMVTFNIPVWSAGKNASMIGEMEKKTEAAESLYKDKQNEINSRAEILVSNIIKWRDLYGLYDKKLIPQTEIALETILSQYKTNSAEFLSVIDSARMLLRYKKDRAMALTEYHSAYSELNKLMGIEVMR
ncbi:MAG TPA: TolC family protein, partial [Spirochaetota bacterium]